MSTYKLPSMVIRAEMRERRLRQSVHVDCWFHLPYCLAFQHYVRKFSQKSCNGAETAKILHYQAWGIMRCWRVVLLSVPPANLRHTPLILARLRVGWGALLLAVIRPNYSVSCRRLIILKSPGNK